MPEETLSSRRLYNGRVLSLRIDQVALKTGGTGVREIIEHAGAVVVVPVDAEGRIQLIRQYRKAIDEVLLELPAGGKKPSEEPLACAQRELAEEIKQAARTWTSLGGFYSAPGFCSEYLHLFLAEDLFDAPLAGDEDEEIEVAPTTPADAYRMIIDNQIRDAKSVAGILRYLALRRPDVLVPAGA
jgi:ADP-ribose pyrophosphatase